MSSASSSSSQPILVTGTSGFVAAHVLNSFLDKGYHVRGTVRSKSSAEKVRKSHAKYGDRLTFAIVPDITAPGAFDEAVQGVVGVIHTASPFVFDVEDYEKDLLLLAIKGTTGILESIQRCNPAVKRVVITSSFASILDIPKGYRPGYTYSEADWNPCTYEEAKQGPGPVAYCASKVFAEKAAFEYVEKNRPNFTVSTICPPMVFGPNAHYIESLYKLNTSSADVWNLINGSTKDIPSTGFPAFADARDVADAHLKAYEIPEAGGERFLITSGNYTNQWICDISRKEFPELRDRTPEGNVGEALNAYKLDTSKARRILGLEFISFEKCIKDTVANLLELEKTIGKA
jgi:nucleoside-diphosphate-sugar epimerase